LHLFRSDPWAEHPEVEHLANDDGSGANRAQEEDCLMLPEIEKRIEADKELLRPVREERERLEVTWRQAVLRIIVPQLSNDVFAARMRRVREMKEG